MTDWYDAVVVGAGPAGSTFARRAAGTGKIAIVSGGRDKPCGGLLAPDAQKALAHFDLVLPNSVLADPQIFSVKTMDLGNGKIRHYQRYYLNMDRAAFDGWLLSLVPESVERISGRVIRVEKVDGGFALRLPERTVFARRVVGADGSGSVVRRDVFGRGIYRYTAIQQWFSCPDRRDPFYSCVFDRKTSESCSWLIHKGDSLIFGGCFEKAGSRAAFDAQKARLEEFLGFHFGEPSRTEACLASRPRRWSDFVTGRDGAYLVGEAAGFISPSSFEGISSAIRSGEALAEAFSRESDQEIARAYRKKTLPLRLKLAAKIGKRVVMYTPALRSAVMGLGIGSIRVISSGGEKKRDT